jgi:hypothetical protein
MSDKQKVFFEPREGRNPGTEASVFEYFKDFLNKDHLKGGKP